jgi:hypothetical protein
MTGAGTYAPMKVPREWWWYISYTILKSELGANTILSYKLNGATLGYTDNSIYMLNFINTNNKNSNTEYMSNWEGKLPSQRRVKMTQKTVLVLGATVIYGLSIFNRQLSIKCNRWSWAMPWLRWVVTGLSPQMPGSVRMGCDGQSDTVTGLSLSVLQFSAVNITPLSIHTHIIWGRTIGLLVAAVQRHSLTP